MNKDLDSLSQYPFYFLSKLLNEGNKVEPNSVNLSIGEPKHSPPQECLDIINKESKAFISWGEIMLGPYNFLSRLILPSSLVLINDKLFSALLNNL